MNPLNPGLNVAVHQIAGRLLPGGFDVSDTAAPDTLESIKAHIAETGRLCVWSGASDHTIFGDRETNWAFRAWHDWCHYRGDLPFTLDGETDAAHMQVEHLIALYGRTEQTAEMAALVLAEVIGQARQLDETGAFPADQVAFDLAKLPLWRTEARRLVLGAA